MKASTIAQALVGLSATASAATLDISSDSTSRAQYRLCSYFVCLNANQNSVSR